MKKSLVLIRWLDTFSSTDWKQPQKLLEDTEYVDNLSICESVGWLIEQDSKRIVLASMIGRDGCTNDRQYIPKGCIIEKKRLDV